MPKIVDHEERKIHIAAATWRVIQREGMKGATVRNIAQEASLSLGALRHYFQSQQDLIAFAMQLVKERATARITAISASGLPPKEMMTRIVLELLPIDAEQQTEMDVWFSYVFHTRIEGNRPFDTEEDGFFAPMKKMLIYLEHHKLLHNGLDLDLEAEKLYAFIDGLAMHALLERDRLDRERIVQTVHNYIQTICV